MKFLENINQETSQGFQTLSLEGKNAKKTLVIVFGYCLFLSLLFLSIGTKSSPLYPFNDWVDANISFTMGKAMMNGRVLYRDIFDHKGPLYYTLYGVGYLISNTTFSGIFTLEVISFTVFLFFCFKSVSLFLDLKNSTIALVLIAGSVINLASFSHGGSAEEFSLPLIAVSLFFLLSYFKNTFPNPMPNKWVLLNGILAGCVLWIKFSLLGFWIGWMAALFLVLIFKQNFSRAFSACLVFLFGMLIATIPWVHYFAVNNALSDWIYSYITFNIKNYSETTSVFSNILSMLINLLYHLWKNPFFVAHLLLGLFFFLKNKKFTNNQLSKLSISLCFFLLFISVYGGGRGFPYYFLILSPFIIFGFIVLLTLIRDAIGVMKSNKSFGIITLLLVLGTFTYTYFLNHNTHMLGNDKEDLVQYKYASIINQTENASLLNYGTLDLGFYTTTGIVPDVKYFQVQNIEYSKYPIIRDAQIAYIRNGVVDYVVTLEVITSNDDDIQTRNLFEKYELIESHTQTYEENDYEFLLYKKSN